jgi:NADH:ubiquinone oxidoreductase subunit C
LKWHRALSRCPALHHGFHPHWLPCAAAFASNVIRLQSAPSPPSSPQPASPSRTGELSAKFVQRFPSARVDYTRARRLKVTVPAELMKEAALFARDELRFDHIGTVSGTDYMAKGEIEVIYFIGSVQEDQRDLVMALAERVPRDAPSVPSLIEVWPGVDFHERETFEMLGVKFQGHPDLRGILLPEDWDDIPPLRKDFVSPGR